MSEPTTSMSQEDALNILREEWGVSSFEEANALLQSMLQQHIKDETAKKGDGHIQFHSSVYDPVTSTYIPLSVNNIRNNKWYPRLDPRNPTKICPLGLNSKRTKCATGLTGCAIDQPVVRETVYSCGVKRKAGDIDTSKITTQVSVREAINQQKKLMVEKERRVRLEKKLKSAQLDTLLAKYGAQLLKINSDKDSALKKGKDTYALEVRMYKKQKAIEMVERQKQLLSTPQAPQPLARSSSSLSSTSVSSTSSGLSSTPSSISSSTSSTPTTSSSTGGQQQITRAQKTSLLREQLNLQQTRNNLLAKLHDNPASIKYNNTMNLVDARLAEISKLTNKQ